MNPVELRKWREAHLGIDIPDTAIAALGSFPSLYANDLADKISMSNPDISAFIRALFKESIWAYDGWSKAQRDADAGKLLADIYTAAGGSGEGDPQNQYTFIRRFLSDYAAANNLPNPAAATKPKDDWSERLGLTPIGTVEVSGPSGNTTTQDPAARPMSGEAVLQVSSPPSEKPSA